MFGLDLLAVSTLWMLASGQPQCFMRTVPHIHVIPQTQDIRYDFRHTSQQLSALRTDTVSPYAPHVDSATGGMREDQPKVSVEVKWTVQEFPQQDAMCFWYDTITVRIELSPKIYIAKDYAKGRCKEAIVEHELKHVKVDREVVNLYAREVGAAVQDAVNRAGVMGPYRRHMQMQIQQSLVEHIQNAVKSKELILMNEMRSRQAAIDSLEEYEQISKICNGVRN